jgi:hypothetical protein
MDAAVNGINGVKELVHGAKELVLDLAWLGLVHWLDLVARLLVARLLMARLDLVARLALLNRGFEIQFRHRGLFMILDLIMRVALC